MILIITNKCDPTSDLVVAELHRRKVAFVRFNTEDFPSQIHCSVSFTNTQKLDAILDLSHNRQVSLSDISAVYYRRPKPYRISEQIASKQARDFAQKESQALIEGLWLGMPCLWVNHPFRIRAADFKVEQLRLAAQLEFSIPQTLITNNTAAASDFFEQCNGQVIAKVLRTGTLDCEDKISLIYTTRLLKEHLNYLDAVQYAPCIFQEYVPKQVEIRVTIVGRQLFAAEIHSQNSERTKDDWRHYDLHNTPHLPHDLPEEVAQRCLALTERLDLHFGAIDLILKPDGMYTFLELNPNGQWGWIGICQ